MVWVSTRNAWPISLGDRPHSQRRISVTCVSRFRPGSHTANIIASWLTLAAAGASAASIVLVSAVVVASSGRNDRCRCSRRMMSIARLWAARTIHAFGSRGNPKRQACMALTSASWTTSSASGTLDGPRTRVSALTRCAYSFRNRSSTSSVGDTTAGRSSTASDPRVLDRTHLDGTAELVGRACARHVDGVFQGGGLEDHAAGHQILRLGVRAVGDHALVTPDRGPRVVERGSGVAPTLPGQLIGPAIPLLDVGLKLRGRQIVPRDCAPAEDQHELAPQGGFPASRVGHHGSQPYPPPGLIESRHQGITA